MNNYSQELVNRCRNHWDGTPETRNEFAGDFEAYVAYVAAMEAGLVKIR